MLVATPHADQFPNIKYGHFLSRTTSSDQTFQAMREWMANCINNHPACHTSNKLRSYTPKRLLDLRLGHMVLREGVTSPQYACLSHCWGPSQSPIQTRLENFNNFKKDIPWRDLSKTFQDAVDICRRLDIDYLWIDSLCIIQNSKDGRDWKEQSVQMADIYGNALITIAATKSKDGSGGCYSQRDDGHVDAHPVVDGVVYTRKELPRVDVRDVNTGNLPLLSRGWVYQEMVLSSRVLHFCSQEVIWRCRTQSESESGSNDGDRNASPDTHRFRIPPLVDPSWYITVHNYSQLALTFETDRLAALAAVAQRAAATRPSDDLYLAGLWQKTLLHDMLWQTYPASSRDGPTERPTAYRGPSWSWASVKSCVQWFAVLSYGFAHRPLSCTKVVSINVQPDGSSYLGHYLRSDIVIRGPLIRTTPRLLEPTMSDNSPEGGSCFNIENTMCVYSFVPDYIWPSAGPDQIPRDGDLFILPLMVRNGGIYLTDGLVLRFLKPPTTYERVGLITLIYTRGGPPWLEPWSMGDKSKIQRSSETPAYIEVYLSTLPDLEITLV